MLCDCQSPMDPPTLTFLTTKVCSPLQSRLASTSTNSSQSIVVNGLSLQCMPTGYTWMHYVTWTMPCGGKFFRIILRVSSNASSLHCVDYRHSISRLFVVLRFLSFSLISSSSSFLSMFGGRFKCKGMWYGCLYTVLIGLFSI